MQKNFIKAVDYFQIFLEVSPDMIVISDNQGKVVECSNSIEHFLGYTKKELVGKAISDLYYNPVDRYKLLDTLKKYGKVIDYETRLKNKSGRIMPISTSMTYFRDGSGRIIGTLGIAKDIHRRKELEQKLAKMAITDGLTGLYDRGYFNVMINKAVEKANNTKNPLSLIMIDLDGFKEHNDTKGHLEGDKVLHEVGRIVHKIIRPKIDTAFRYGGDEFVILIPGQYEDAAMRSAEKIRRDIEHAFKKQITASIGVSRLRPYQSSYSLIKSADEAMYRSKKYGGNRVSIG
ncbi:MAG: sensor domain-containing diguanylate cyclase [Planctomycetota bacterium]